ncbi:uncharacterized protein BDZ99DRAFT_451564 [Mytilinidion resinicola]|uniref:Uncharacterized protein n=1 Tax=Mytilinidion resinicola TaxID=574789 RepID=A0A6A6YAZ3_9PEZI|nr:uncharacterized protein BDZ99DRAFT_451564 [Mytilinidion resinicola]KAF2805007.1 hypothetical protein BDZ99DRAFT_451564 [Mytilinidion resinicola]
MFGFKFGSKRFPFMEREKTVYAALRDGASSPSDDDLEEKNSYARPTSTMPGRLWRISVVLLLLATNLSTLIALITTKQLAAQIDSGDPVYTPKSWARVDTLPTTFTRFNWWTVYSEKNFTETDALWDAINPAHGFIAMDREWAKSQHWPDSMHLPSDPSKNVYLLEAYHLLHCTVIRKTFWQAIHREEPYYFNPPHAGHCIDMLRQYVMCKADNTPLYLFGDDTAGDEQYRKCNNWDVLRQFATDNSACYRDTPPDVDKNTFPLGAHFGYCDGGYDGLIEGERRGPWKHGVVFDGPD